MKKITLPIKATDNHGYSYWVTLKLKDGDKLGWILSIDETPGSWYMDTLLGKDEYSGSRSTRKIYIDFGQDWFCNNIDNVLFTAEVLCDHEDGRLQAA